MAGVEGNGSIHNGDGTYGHGVTLSMGFIMGDWGLSWGVGSTMGIKSTKGMEAIMGMGSRMGMESTMGMVSTMGLGSAIGMGSTMDIFVHGGYGVSGVYFGYVVS